MNILLATCDADIDRCYAVMRQVRPHLEQADFAARVRRQQLAGYHLACLEDQGQVVAVAGFRLQENLSWGKFLYIDDLVTDAAQRSRGAGAALFDWLVRHAREQQCIGLHLDSGVQRFDAHRFYLGQRMHIAAYHFALALPAEKTA